MGENLLVSPSIRDNFGGRAIELAGRVIDPERQREGIGSNLLETFLLTHRTELLTTYTRNPAVINMIRSVTSGLSLDNDELELQHIASAMPHATTVRGVSYHLNRYDEGGLFKGDDPAQSTIATPPIPLNDYYKELQDVRNALAIAASVQERFQL